MGGTFFTYMRLGALLVLLSLTGAVVSVAQSGAPPGGGAGQRGTPAPPGGGTGQQDGVEFSAADSLVYHFGGERRALLYGQATVIYEPNRLSAGEISMLLDRDEVQARSDTPGDTLSYPVLSMENQELRSAKIAFNYVTEKGKFDELSVQVQDGYLVGKSVKNVSRSEVFIEEGRYSTCPPTHMYYYLQADRMKVVDQEEIFFTNARLFILDIPYPVVFPFGYVPAGIEDRESGLLQPTYVYQDQVQRGIGLQNIGWFQYFNDYFTAQTSFDVFTSGTFFNESRMQYRATDRFNGSVTIGYSKERDMEPTDPDYTERVNKRLSITHSQQFSPYASLSANINLNTSDYFRRNSYDIDERSQTSSSSSMSYRYRHPEQVYNFSMSARLNQQYATNTTRLNGPETSFSFRQFVPFENSSPAAVEQRWYETITIGYNNNFRSEFEFRPTDGTESTVGWLEALLNPELYREATGDDAYIQYGFRQQGQVSISQLVNSQFLNTGLSFNINDYWYPSSIRKVYNQEEDRVETMRESGIVSARDFNTSLNLSTAIYGTSGLHIGNFEGFRHTLRPSISLSYRPDFSSDEWGYYRDVPVDSVGNTQRYSIFEDAIYGGPGLGEQQLISFSLGNVLEAKQVRRDSTGEVQSNNLRIFDNLNFSTSYNLAADSLNFSNVNVSFSSSIIENISIQASATYSLYARDENGTPMDRFIWQETGKLVQPLNYSVSLGTRFSGGAGYGTVSTPMYQPYDPLNQAFFSPIDRRFNNYPIQPLNSSWGFGLNFSYQWRYRHRQSPQQSAILNANNIRFNLTPKWTINTRVGYDFIQRELTPSQFNLERRMVCWTLSFQFNPFGDFQYYFFRLSIDSSQIQGLFQKLPLLNNLERSSSPTGRAPRF